MACTRLTTDFIHVFVYEHSDLPLGQHFKDSLQKNKKFLK